MPRKHVKDCNALREINLKKTCMKDINTRDNKMEQDEIVCEVERNLLAR